MNFIRENIWWIYHGLIAVVFILSAAGMNTLSNVEIPEEK